MHMDGLFIDWIQLSCCYDLRSSEGMLICLCRTYLVDNFGRTGLAWASMQLQSHRLDAKGPHVESKRSNLEDLKDDLDNID
jgi:hypothetical protein